MRTVAIVVPVYSGESYLRELVAQISALRDSWGLPSRTPFRLERLVLVDDNAIDRSPELIDELSSLGWVKAVHLSRNYGQHAATISGILHTEEDWVVTLDEDLQHPPSLIPSMLLEAVKTSSDVIYGRPISAVHQKATRDWTSRTFKSLMEWATGERNIRLTNSFRLMRGPVARAAAQACAHDTYFDAALFWFTQRVRALPMHLQDSRFISTGKSGYRLRSLLSHARRLLISSQIKFLRIGAAFGIGLSALSLLLGGLIVAIRLLVPEYIASPGWASIMVAIMFFSGVILFINGIVLEYLSVLLVRSNGRPLYFEIDRSGDSEILPFLEQEEAFPPQIRSA